MEPELHKFGFRSFRNVNGEPWHIQPSEIPAGRRRATRLPPLHSPVLQGASAPAPAPFTPSIPVATIRKGSTCLNARQLQDHLRNWAKAGLGVMDPGNPDGQFGTRSEASLKTFQRIVLKTTVDGVYGPQSYRKMLDLARYLAAVG